MTRLAEKEPGKYERAAARWHVRFFPEVPNVDILENQAVLALLAAIPANRLAGAALAELLSLHPLLRPLPDRARTVRSAGAAARSGVQGRREGDRLSSPNTMRASRTELPCDRLDGHT
jgi:hypothetical protein